MKLTVIGLTVAAVFFTAQAALADGNLNFDGTPVQVQAVQLHVQGQPVNAEQIVLSLHEMNQHGSQPAGLWVYFYVRSDVANGNEALCQQWSSQVASDQASRSAESTTFPYLEIQISEDAQSVVTDEGYELLPDTGISCWEALEMKAKAGH